MAHSLSVLLPVHNTQATLARQVEQILDVLPELTRDFELIIIDDGSTDATIEVADELAHRYPQVRAVRQGEPQGRAAAVERGLTCSSGNVICLQDEAHGLPLDEIHSVWRALDRGHRGLRTIDREGNEDAGVRVMRPTASGFQVERRVDGELAERPGENWPAAARPVTEKSPSAAAVCETASKPAKPNFLIRFAKLALGE